MIRERFSVYFGLSARKVETMQPVEAVVAELIAALATQQAVNEPDMLGSGRSDGPRKQD